MTKSKNTKRALLMSVLSMMLCIAMLAGSTFAWFTDSVTSGKNRIVAGNLDVELYYKNASTKKDTNNASTDGWANASEASVASPNFFVDKDGNDILWEPGVMAVTQFKVANVGSLALKYALATLKQGFNSLEEVVKDENGNETEPKYHDLSEVIKFAMIENKDYTEGTTTREDILALNPEFKDFTGFTAGGHLLPKDKATDDAPFEKIFTVVAYWAPNANEVDNLYNVNNGRKTDDDADRLYINIDIRLNATQYTYENDSFGNDYDETAEYYPIGTDERAEHLVSLGYAPVKTEADFAKAIENGQKVVLTSDVAVDIVTVADGETAVVDLNGQKLTADGDFAFDIKAGGKAELSNGTVEGKKYGVVSRGGNVKLTNVSVTAKESYAVASYSGSVVEMANCEAKSEGARSDAIAVSGSSGVKLSNVKVTAVEVGVISRGENNTIEITDSVINSNYFGVYHNGSNAPATVTIKNTTIVDTVGSGVYISNSVKNPLQTLTIDNCDITGVYSAVEVKHTNATITNSTLTATYKNDNTQGVQGSASSISTWGYAFASAINGGEEGKGRGTVTLEGNIYNIDATITEAKIYDVITDGTTLIYTEPGVTLTGSDFPAVGSD